MINCTFENGRSTSLRHVTVDALVVKSGQLLLIGRAADLFLEAGKYALPGGFLNRDETVAEGCQREVREETGYEIKLVSLFRIITNPSRRGEDRQNVNFVFLTEAENQVSQPDQEVSHLSWFDFTNLPNHTKVAFDHWETINLFLKYSRKPFSLPLLN